MRLSVSGLNKGCNTGPYVYGDPAAKDVSAGGGGEGHDEMEIKTGTRRARKDGMSWGDRCIERAHEAGNEKSKMQHGRRVVEKIAGKKLGGER